MVDDSIHMVMLDIDMGYLVTLGVGATGPVSENGLFRVRPPTFMVPRRSTSSWRGYKVRSSSLQGLATRSVTVCSWCTGVPVHSRLLSLLPGLV